MPDRRTFGTNERRAANDAQVATFFQGYERSWRLSKLLLIRAMLQDRARLQPHLRIAYGDALHCDDAYVYGPLTNGLIFSAVAELTMLAEDLFAILSHIRSREHFAKRLVHYRAGTITNLAKWMKSASSKRVLAAFMVPTTQQVGALSPDDAEAYEGGAAELVRLVRSAGSIHEKHEHRYNQYKHGLTVALRPYGATQLPEQVIAKRKTSLSGALVTFEALHVGKSKKRSSAVQFMLHPETQPFLNELHASDNLLRFDGEARETFIDDLIAAAYELTKLVDIVVCNRIDLITPRSDSPTANTFCLPLDDKAKPLALVSVAVQRDAGRWTLDAFREDL